MALHRMILKWVHRRCSQQYITGDISDSVYKKRERKLHEKKDKHGRWQKVSLSFIDIGLLRRGCVLYSSFLHDLASFAVSIERKNVEYTSTNVCMYRFPSFRWSLSLSILWAE